jgi:outer membrane autotransporter protein
MKKSLILMLMMLTLSTTAIKAQNRWNIHTGGNLSHFCETPWVSSDKSYSWGGGAFVGGGYEIAFDSNWSLTPQLDLSYVDNGATLSDKGVDFYSNHASWLSTWSLNIPVIASYKFPISDNAKLRFGVGPYLQYALAGRQYKNGSDTKENVCGNFSKRLNVGVIGEAAVETGSHFSYMFRVQYPFLKEGWVRKTITLSLGVGYSF